MAATPDVMTLLVGVLLLSSPLVSESRLINARVAEALAGIQAHLNDQVVSLDGPHLYGVYEESTMSDTAAAAAADDTTRLSTVAAAEQDRGAESTDAMTGTTGRLMQELSTVMRELSTGGTSDGGAPSSEPAKEEVVESSGNDEGASPSQPPRNTAAADTRPQRPSPVLSSAHDNEDRSWSKELDRIGKINGTWTWWPAAVVVVLLFTAFGALVLNEKRKKGRISGKCSQGVPHATQGTHSAKRKRLMQQTDSTNPSEEAPEPAQGTLSAKPGIAGKEVQDPTQGMDSAIPSEGGTPVSQSVPEEVREPMPL
ncbi:hypothetical protein CBR_g39108 [Chara braunii]|uniref:Uncharacterized protein n=1 Tax=Chara braunii TaxID=69332 RepID=A0A388LRB2_CHABU|nr:hypothetical protein CBR_g39108 [Chara braunii]|eukprot:GBG84732.1 hypothetical protein CBR_g39108 [Chara braunii]